VGEFASGEQLRVVGAGATSLYFRLPPDLHYANHSGIPLRLNVRLGGLTAGTGVRMGIRLNGTVVEHRDFRAAGASMVLRETVRLPVPHLYPRNTLTVEFSYDGKGPTVPIEAVILRDSGIDITGIAQFVRMPRLDLLAAAGFPFTRMADLSGTAVVLPSRPTPEQIGLYLGLMGFFGAQTGIPALRVSVADPDRVEDVAAKDLLVLGSGQDQPLFSRWAHWLPVRMDSDQFLLNAPRRPYSLLAQLPVALGNERRRLSELLAGETPADAIIQAAASPFHGGHSIVTVMTPGSTSLEPLVRVLERSVHTQDVQGSLSILKGGRFHSFHLPVAGYHAGRLPWPAALDYLVRVWFWVLPIVILGLALGLAWILDHFFSRVRCTRLAGRPSIT
jgi:cellulose synthase (UDP-forming)